MTPLELMQTNTESIITPLLSEAIGPSNYRLKEAMRYTVVNGGKRVRPMLVYATCKALDIDLEPIQPLMTAIELIHAYSLVHDDLPAMDNDELRRGLPTCHIQYDEATAILVGDALQTLAFEQLAQLPAETLPHTLRYFAQAAGANGMVLGQAIDIESTGLDITIDQLTLMHKAKTGALIQAACVIPALATKAIASHIEALEQFSSSIGLAFQVQDDILDVISDTQTLGKPQGSDHEANKATFVKLLGLDGAISHRDALLDNALHALTNLPGDISYLKTLSQYIINRSY